MSSRRPRSGGTRITKLASRSRGRCEKLAASLISPSSRLLATTKRTSARNVRVPQAAECIGFQHAQRHA